MLSKAPPVPQLPPPTSKEVTPSSSGDSQSNAYSTAEPAPDNFPNPELEEVPAEVVHGIRVDAAVGPLEVSLSAGVVVSRREAGQAAEQPQIVANRNQQPMSDRLFSIAAIGLTLAIVALLVKKFMKSYAIPGFMESL